MESFSMLYVFVPAPLTQDNIHLVEGVAGIIENTRVNKLSTALDQKVLDIWWVEGNERFKAVNGECLVAIVSYTTLGTDQYHSKTQAVPVLAHPPKGSQRTGSNFEECFPFDVKMPISQLSGVVATCGNAPKSEVVQLAVNLAATLDCFAVQHGILPYSQLAK
jgi:hypothetical protein